MTGFNLRAFKSTRSQHFDAISGFCEGNTVPKSAIIAYLCPNLDTKAQERFINSELQTVFLAGTQTIRGEETGVYESLEDRLTVTNIIPFGKNGTNTPGEIALRYQKQTSPKNFEKTTILAEEPEPDRLRLKMITAGNTLYTWPKQETESSIVQIPDTLRLTLTGLFNPTRAGYEIDIAPMTPDLAFDYLDTLTEKVRPLQEKAAKESGQQNVIYVATIEHKNAEKQTYKQDPRFGGAIVLAQNIPDIAV